MGIIIRCLWPLRIIFQKRSTRIISSSFSLSFCLFLSISLCSLFLSFSLLLSPIFLSVLSHVPTHNSPSIPFLSFLWSASRHSSMVGFSLSLSNTHFFSLYLSQVLFLVTLTLIPFLHPLLLLSLEGQLFLISAAHIFSHFSYSSISLPLSLFHTQFKISSSFFVLSFYLFSFSLCFSLCILSVSLRVLVHLSLDSFLPLNPSLLSLQFYQVS